MRTETESPNGVRREALRQMLTRLRDETYEKVRDFRRDQQDEAQPPPADEMDAARSTADVETHASLIARAEERLRFIDAAIARAERGRYGICAECGDEIAIERLAAVPFAVYCVDCQGKRNRGRRWGEGTMIEPYDRQWTPPEEMEEPSGREYRHTGPEDEVAIHYDSPFGPESGEAGEPPAPKRRRGRPRKSDQR
jgi:RNA polymerase-binding transcription factor